MLDKAFQFFHSFKFKVGMTVIATLLVFLSASIYLWYTNSLEFAKENSVEYINEILHISNSYFENNMREVRQTLDRMAISSDVIDYTTSLRTDEALLVFSRRRVENYMTALFNTQRLYNIGAYIYCLDGEWTSIGTPVTLKDIQNRVENNFESLTVFEQSIIIPPRVIDPAFFTTDSNSRNDVISVVKKISRNNKPTGLIVIDIDADMIVDQFYSRIKGIGTIFMLDENRNIMFKDNLQKTGFNIGDNSLKKITESINDISGYQYMDIDNQKYLMVYNHSQYIGWTSLALVPYENLLKKFDITHQKLIISALLLCVAAIITTLLITYMLTSNLNKLHNIVSRVGKNNLEITASIRTKDEIGLLYQQFRNLIFRIKELVADIKLKEEAKRKAEIQVLQAQINPHFLHNTLNTIKTLADMIGAENIIRVSDSLSALLHINMDKNKEFITVSEEIEYIKNYVSIQDYKYLNGFTVKYNIDDDVKDKHILKLILQPLVENAMTHGIILSNHSGLISIDAYKKGGFLHISVEDNGVGIPKDRISEILESPRSKNIGIYNVDRRIKMYFGEAFGLRISSEPGVFTCIEAVLPCIEAEEVKKYV